MKSESTQTRDLLQAMQDTRVAMRGFVLMLDLTLSSEGILARHSYGITSLLERQIEDLEELEQSLRAAFKERQPEPVTLRDTVDAGSIAETLKMKRETVERVIAQLQPATMPDDPAQQAQAVNG